MVNVRLRWQLRRHAQVIRQFASAHRFHLLLKLALTLALDAFGGEMGVCRRVLLRFGLIVFQDNIEAALLTFAAVGIVDQLIIRRCRLLGDGQVLLFSCLNFGGVGHDLISRY